MRLQWVVLPIITFGMFAIHAGAQEAPNQEPVTSHESEFLAKVSTGSIFIYRSNIDPCAPPPSDITVNFPLGSGFVVGIRDNKNSTADRWRGWKFLITAKHVVADETEVVIRLNLAHEEKFVCHSLSLRNGGRDQNVFFGALGVDIAAVTLPDIPETDPAVIDASSILDEPMMKKWDIGVGTQVFTVGYIFGYSGPKANFPVTKFGQVSLITGEKWFYNPDSKLIEQGYVIQLPNSPGLSGAPVLTHGMEFDTSPFRFRQLPPYIVGVMKALLLAPAHGNLISQDLAVIEPASNLRDLVRDIALRLKEAGADVDAD
jgi:hypothetical protein